MRTCALTASDFPHPPLAAHLLEPQGPSGWLAAIPASPRRAGREIGCGRKKRKRGAAREQHVQVLEADPKGPMQSVCVGREGQDAPGVLSRWLISAKVLMLGPNDPRRRMGLPLRLAWKGAHGVVELIKWRRGRDSNPRYAFGVHTLSRRAPSTARTPLPQGAKTNLGSWRAQRGQTSRHIGTLGPHRQGRYTSHPWPTPIS